MANITEISDGGPNPNTPTVQQMRESQRLGSVGAGTQSESFNQMQGNFNMGVGVDQDAGGDKPSYDRWSNDDIVAEYPDGEPGYGFGI